MRNRYLLLLVTLSLCGLSLLGCSPNPNDPRCAKETLYIRAVQRVFMHSWAEYSILYKKEGQAALEQHFFHHYSGDRIKLVPDVAQGQSVYVVSKLSGSSGERCLRKVEIHIHTAADVNGGGWDSGKQGFGQTNVVE